MGAGPQRYLAAGADRTLRGRGHDVDVRGVRRRGQAGDDVEAVLDINAELAREVRAVLDEDRFPLLAGGNCNVALGILAALGTQATGIVWLDAHGDFNTPETSPGGFVDGMPLAMATGRCYPQVWQRLGAKPAPVPEAHVLHVGGRDLDPGEEQTLTDSGVEVVTGADIGRRGVKAALVPALDTLRGHVDAVYLHIDVDVLDPAAAPAVDFPSAGGLTVPELEEAIWLVAGHFSVRAAALTAYDPERDDPDGRTLQTSLHLLTVLADTVAD